ncbi:glycosyltransferase family 1 protein [Mariannaea sp. PMI_226]|nr:glycosyltransferase family 1 protein [Mariannaea sp. PMI_226]
MARTDGVSPSDHRKVLLLTDTERGESNVFLATCAALLYLDPEVEIHFATFAELKPFIDSLEEQVRIKSPHVKPIVVHEIKGMSNKEAVHDAVMRRKVSITENCLPRSYANRPGFFNTPRAIHDTVGLFSPYTGPQLVQVFSSIVEIIKTVNANIVVVSSIMTAGLTACYHLGIRFACLSPNSIREFAAPLQPHGASLWKYPALFSAFPYPVPWYLIPSNIYFSICTIIGFWTDSDRHQVIEYLRSETGAILRTPVDLLRRRPPSLKILVSTLPELDFPAIIPPHLLPCGPIMRLAPPIKESDPALQSWLAMGPTIYINLGSLFRLCEYQAVEIALALKSVMDSFHRQTGSSQLRVLWKLKKAGDYEVSKPGSKVYDVLGSEMLADRIRISGWIGSEPVSILQSGHVVCSVHHGGANSYNEAITAGVPQVVLPQWTDCYDYAHRVEMLGVGRWGSRNMAPRWTTQDLAHEILEVVQGETSRAMKKRSKAYADLCKERGHGAMNAAKILLDECHKEWVQAGTG